MVIVNGTKLIEELKNGADDTFSFLDIADVVSSDIPP